MKKIFVFTIILIFFQICIGQVFSANLAHGFQAVTVTDHTGKSLTLVNPPQRIACLYAFSGHVVAMLGRGEDMVAVVNGLKKDKLLYQIIPNIQKIPIPSNGGIINIEELLKTRPDIVFLKPETANIKGEIKKLERFRLLYFVAGYNSMAQQMTLIEMMGKAIGCHAKAQAYNRYYKDMIDLVRSRTQHIPKDKRVRLYHSINEPHRTDATGTIEADWTNVCGVINVSVRATLREHDNKKFAGMEQILIWNPEVIIVNEEGVDQLILTDKKWASLKAVQDGKVFTIPVGISRWGHPGGLETPLAIIWTAKKVYPDLFQDVDMKAKTSLFYKRFFNLSLEDRMLDKILSGKGRRQDKTEKFRKN